MVNTYQPFPQEYAFSTLFRLLIKLLQQVYEFFMTNVESMVQMHFHLPPLLASLLPLNSHWYTNPPYAFLKTATIPTYYGIFIAIPRYIDMKLPPFRLMTCAVTLILPLHDRKIASMMFPWLVHFFMSLLRQIIAHPGTPPEAFIQSHIFVLVLSCNIEL